MLVWEKEYNKAKRILKLLVFILIFFLLSPVIYYIFFPRDDLIFNEKKIEFDVYGFDPRKIDEIITKFDYEFLTSKKYMLLKEKAYYVSVDISSGHDNPFQPYEIEDKEAPNDDSEVDILSE